MSTVPSTEPSSATQYGAATMAVLIACVGLYFYTSRLLRRRALQRCEQEAEAMRQAPRVFTASELARYDGRHREHPLLLSIKGRVLDVRSGTDYYGPDGGPYKIMAGRDASRAFAMMSLKEEDAHPDLSGVDAEHLKILDDWYDKLAAKYPTVGCSAGNRFGYKLPAFDPTWVSSAAHEKDE